MAIAIAIAVAIAKLNVPPQLGLCHALIYMCELVEMHHLLYHAFPSFCRCHLIGVRTPLIKHQQARRQLHRALGQSHMYGPTEQSSSAMPWDLALPSTA